MTLIDLMQNSTFMKNEEIKHIFNHEWIYNILAECSDSDESFEPENLSSHSIPGEPCIPVVPVIPFSNGLKLFKHQIHYLNCHYSRLAEDDIYSHYCVKYKKEVHECTVKDKCID